MTLGRFLTTLTGASTYTNALGLPLLEPHGSSGTATFLNPQLETPVAHTGECFSVSASNDDCFSVSVSESECFYINTGEEVETPIFPTIDLLPLGIHKIFAIHTSSASRAWIHCDYSPTESYDDSFSAIAEITLSVSPNGGIYRASGISNIKDVTTGFFYKNGQPVHGGDGAIDSIRGINNISTGDYLALIKYDGSVSNELHTFNPLTFDTDMPIANRGMLLNQASNILHGDFLPNGMVTDGTYWVDNGTQKLVGIDKYGEDYNTPYPRGGEGVAKLESILALYQNSGSAYFGLTTGYFVTDRGALLNGQDVGTHITGNPTVALNFPLANVWELGKALYNEFYIGYVVLPPTDPFVNISTHGGDTYNIHIPNGTRDTTISGFYLIHCDGTSFLKQHDALTDWVEDEPVA